MDISAAYEKHKHLKHAANELGIPWQTLYCRLKAAGIPVTGDKLRYGNDRDKLAAHAEAAFKRLVPSARNANGEKYQAEIDFVVGGLKVDVKASMPRKLNAKYPAESWAFSFKRQSSKCDFFVCFCMDEEKQPEMVLLVPREFFDGLQTISVTRLGQSKWKDYQIKPDELAPFFADLNESKS
jgi:hypothetical protein